jgi:hypothetical protein
LPCDPTLPPPRRRLDAQCRARLHGTKTRRGRAHTHRRSQRCLPVNGLAAMQAEAMATIRVNAAEHSKP